VPWEQRKKRNQRGGQGREKKKGKYLSLHFRHKKHIKQGEVVRRKPGALTSCQEKEFQNKTTKDQHKEKKRVWVGARGEKENVQ